MVKWVTKEIKTRKEHNCGSCSRSIPVGSLVQFTKVYPNGNKNIYRGSVDRPIRYYFCNKCKT